MISAIEAIVALTFAIVLSANAAAQDRGRPHSPSASFAPSPRCAREVMRGIDWRQIGTLFPSDSLRRALAAAPGSGSSLRRFLSNAPDLDLNWSDLDTYLDSRDRRFTPEGKNELLVVSVEAVLSRYQHRLLVEITDLRRRERISNIHEFETVADDSWIRVWQRATGNASAAGANDYVRFVKSTLSRLRGSGC